METAEQLPLRPQSSTIKMNKWQVFRQLGYEARQGVQVEISQSVAQYRVIVAGRRWGKSLSASKEADAMILTPGTMGTVVSTNHKLVDKVFREIYNDLIIKAKLGQYLVAKNLTPPYRLKFNFPWGEGFSEVNGGSCENPNSLVGEGNDWIIFDEAAQNSKDIWDQYLSPTLADTNGWAMFITTPRGHNWIYDFFRQGKSEAFPEWDSWQIPTWDNPKITKGFIEEQRRILDEATFDQEYGAEFTSMSGRVYGDFSEAIHVVPESEIHIDPSWPRYRTIDFGYENPFVCLWIAANPIDDTIIVYDEYFQRHTTVEKHAEFINGYLPAFDSPDHHYEYTTCDPSGASARATLLENGIVTLGPSIRSVDQGLEIVRGHIKKRRDGKPKVVVSTRCADLIKEFLLYAYPKTGTNEDPLKENDHGMDAYRYWATVFSRTSIRELQAVYN